MMIRILIWYLTTLQGQDLFDGSGDENSYLLKGDNLILNRVFDLEEIQNAIRVETPRKENQGKTI